MAGVVKPLTAVPAVIAAFAAGLGPAVLITALAVLTLIAAVVFFPSDAPTRRLAQLLTAARRKDRPEKQRAIPRR